MSGLTVHSTIRDKERAQVVIHATGTAIVSDSSSREPPSFVSLIYHFALNLFRRIFGFFRSCCRKTASLEGRMKDQCESSTFLSPANEVMRKPTSEILIATAPVEAAPCTVPGVANATLGPTQNLPENRLIIGSVATPSVADGSTASAVSGPVVAQVTAAASAVVGPSPSLSMHLSFPDPVHFKTNCFNQRMVIRYRNVIPNSESIDVFYQYARQSDAICVQAIFSGFKTDEKEGKYILDTLPLFDRTDLGADKFKESGALSVHAKEHIKFLNNLKQDDPNEVIGIFFRHVSAARDDWRDFVQPIRQLYQAIEGPQGGQKTGKKAAIMCVFIRSRKQNGLDAFTPGVSDRTWHQMVRDIKPALKDIVTFDYWGKQFHGLINRD